MSQQVTKKQQVTEEIANLEVTDDDEVASEDDTT